MRPDHPSYPGCGGGRSVPRCCNIVTGLADMLRAHLCGEVETGDLCGEFPAVKVEDES
jgi:hypothetical protein